MSGNWGSAGDRRHQSPRGADFDGTGRPLSDEDEVLGNILRQSVGDHTLAAFNLPEAFLRRVAGRVIRSSYESRFRIVVPRAGQRGAGQPSFPAPRVQGSGAGVPDAVRVVDDPARSGGGALAWWRSLREERPCLRGFRVPAPGAPVSLAQGPAAADDAGLRRAAAVVAERLATDGLLPTLAAAIEAIGPARVHSAGEGGAAIVGATGLPVDLLAFFRIGGRATAEGGAMVREVAGRLAVGTARGAELSGAEFEFRPSRAGFRASSDAGDEPVGMLRLQLTSGTYWGGVGAGSGLDIARQLAGAAPDLRLVVSIERRFLDEFLAGVGIWPRRQAGQVTVIPEELTVAQWAQDNGKPGVVGTGASARVATLVPRYASRGEDGSTFVPGESSLMHGFAAAGHEVMQSPLMFQGGNLMAVRNPATGERVLLVGEAEVWRNTALGLTERQAIEALRVEMGADRCEVLPAASFHIDYEVSVRVHAGRVVAFVNDTVGAARMIVRTGVKAMESKRLLPSLGVRTALEHLAAGRDGDAMAVVGPAVYARAVGPGQFPESLAEAFSAGPSDSGVGNLQRLLLAMDLLASGAIGEQESGMDPHLLAYLRSFQRTESARQELHARLAAMGWDLVKVPSLGDGERSINYVNGLHTPDRYFMPAYGGLFSPLDDAALKVFRDALGPGVKVVPILCGETQRRQGALRCAVVVYPRERDERG